MQQANELQDAFFPNCLEKVVSKFLKNFDFYRARNTFFSLVLENIRNFSFSFKFIISYFILIYSVLVMSRSPISQLKIILNYFL